MNVSEQLLDILANEGIKHIFGVAGDALNPLVSAIGKRDDINWIRVNHEENGAYAAFAQGELTGNFGVCASTVGPGALHLINGLYNAKKERSPVIAITGQIPVEHIGTNYHQEVDLTKVYDDVCAYQAIIRSPEEAPRVILRAIRIAINESAVCRIELPADIAEMPAANTDFVHQVYRSASVVMPAEVELQQIAKVLNEASTVGILAGAGCRNAKAEVLELAKRLKAPITHSLRASDIFDHQTPQVVGLSGLIGNPSGYQAIMECEVLLMLGTDFPYTNFLPENTKTIQIDVRAENIGNRTSVDYGLHADLKSAASALIPLVVPKTEDAFLHELEDKFQEWLESRRAEADADRDIEPLHPQIFTQQISDQADDDAIFVIETGAAAIWASNFMSFHGDRRMIGSFNHGSMGVGLPGAIGAQMAYPDREVWAIVGDGAFNMTLQDFMTAVTYELPIKILVLNNSQLGFVKIEMEEAGLKPNLEALKVNNFDFAAFAQLCGAQGIKVEHASAIAGAIAQAKASKGPFVINAIVNSGELALPPHIGWKEASGFGLSKVKEVIAAIGGDKGQWKNLKKEVEAFFD